MPLDYAGMVLEAVLPQLVWLIPGLVVVTAVKALVPQLSGWAGEAWVGAKLKRLFPEARHDLILPDGRDGLTQIDHLALTPVGLLVVETKTFSGIILGQANESTWTQVIGRQRHSFQNPLRQNYGHVRAIETLVPDILVEGRVVFAGPARFPKGLPEGVCHVSELADELAPLRQGDVSPILRAAWERVLAASRTDRAAHKEHLRGLQARHGGVRSTRVPALLLAFSVLWLGGVWVYHRPTTEWPMVKTSVPTSSQRPSAVPAPPVPDWKPLQSLATARPVSQPGRPAPTTEHKRPELAAAPEPVNTIEWAELRKEASGKEECAIATAAVLVGNTAENRRTRDLSCGQVEAH